ncbi:MAG: galactokinase, partial [bacterium]
MENQTKSLIADTLSQFKNIFQTNPEIYVTAPGRVNLIGEHTDYNQGFVLPAAINKTIVIAASPRKDRTLSIYSDNYHSHVQVSLNKLQTTNENFWANYIKGVAFFLQESGFKLHGANLYVHGDIPPGAGLSSSAALEMAAAFTFLALNDLEYSDDDIITLCHKAENEFVGVQCGIM